MIDRQKLVLGMYSNYVLIVSYKLSWFLCSLILLCIYFTCNLLVRYAKGKVIIICKGNDYLSSCYSKQDISYCISKAHISAPTNILDHIVCTMNKKETSTIQDSLVTSFHWSKTNKSAHMVQVENFYYQRTN